MTSDPDQTTQATATTATTSTTGTTMGSTTADRELDRPARIRRALRALVAGRGFHGASMQAVAREAGVAAGTAYVHYDSKDDLVIDAYRELKAELSAAAVAGVALDLAPADRFLALWSNIHRFLAAEPERARFLLQVDGSPYADAAHEAAMAGNSDDPLMAAMADALDLIVDLPPVVVFDLAIGPAVRLVAGGHGLDDESLDRLASSCWRAIRV